MSMYGALFGKNPLSGMMLGILGLTEADVGRFRDCFISESEEGGERMIAVYTRNGGGNRECWEEGADECSCYGCTMSTILPKHPQYAFDRDDDFDCTYATIYFHVPEAAKELVEFLAGVQPDGVEDPQRRFADLMDGLRAGDRSDPSVAAALKVGEAIFAALSPPEAE